MKHPKMDPQVQFICKHSDRAHKIVVITQGGLDQSALDEIANVNPEVTIEDGFLATLNRKQIMELAGQEWVRRLMTKKGYSTEVACGYNADNPMPSLTLEALEMMGWQPE